MQPDYSRQILLKEIGPQGQAALARARVLIVGAGGLGSPVLQYLAGAGVGCLGLVDADTLDASNLHRQPIFALADVGKAKVELAMAAVKRINPTVQVELHAGRFDADNAVDLVSAYDVVVDCSDNFRTKYLINDAAVLTHRPAVFASVYQYEGQLQVYKPTLDHACLRCLWPDAVADGVVGNCAEAGVMGPVPGTFGALQALIDAQDSPRPIRSTRRRIVAAGFHEFLEPQNQGAAPPRVSRARLRSHSRDRGRGNRDRDHPAILGGGRAARAGRDRHPHGSGIRRATDRCKAHRHAPAAGGSRPARRRAGILVGMRLGQAQPGGGARAAQARPRRALAGRRPASPGGLPVRFDSKLPDVGTTIFTVMSRRALEEGALNIGQGFPDYAIDPRLAASLVDVIGEGRNQYAPMEGVVELRERISIKLQTSYGRRFDPLERDHRDLRRHRSPIRCNPSGGGSRG